MSSCESALVDVLTRPVQGPVSAPALTWVVTGAWPRAAMPFDVAYAQPPWSDSLGL
ncbi:hypothetical protein ACAG24_024965 [Mycobacterium sp. pW049]|uniref:hypothetical protein n=1 Tax=[Mycobacterium] bulgaricum TaxID=3238985 RepID=UPI00351B15ED